EDGRYVYVKTMDGNLLGVSTAADSMDVAWRSALQLPYELTPSAVATNGIQVFLPSHSCLFSGYYVIDGEVLCQYKCSNAMINPIFVLSSNHVIISTMDGMMMKLYLGSE